LSLLLTEFRLPSHERRGWAAKLFRSSREQQSIGIRTTRLLLV
jgi:hypothetical protein